MWQAALAFAGVWIVVAFLFRYSSLAALVAASAVPFILLASGHSDYAVLFAVMSVIVVVTHRANISRLRSGAEPRIGAGR
jgi:acyl phosphate:glycerol-3-phosphate acyltransferase